MKKKIILILSLIVFFSIIWVYFANKFEKMVENHFLPYLEKHKSQISFNSLEINKYKFNVVLNEVRFFPESKILSFYSDKVIVRRVLFKKSIDLVSLGEKEGKIIHPENVLYAPEHKVYIRVNHIGSTIEAFDADIKFDKFKLLESQTLIPIMQLDNYNLSYNWKIENENSFSIDVDSTGKIKPSSYYPEFLIIKIAKIIGISDNILAQYFPLDEDNVYYSKIDNVLYEPNNALVAKNKLKFIYDKELLKKFISYLEQPEKIKLVFILKSLIENNYSLILNSQSSNNFSNTNFNFNLINNENFKFKMDIDGGVNYSKEQKEQLLELMAEEGYKNIFKNINNNSKYTNENLISQNDYKEIIRPLVNFENVLLNVDIDYYNNTSSLDFLFNIGLNKYSAEYKGNYKNLILDSVFKINDYRNFLYGLANYTEQALTPYIKKSLNIDLTNEEFKKSIEVIKNDVLIASEVINKNNQIKNYEALIVPFEINFRTVDLKINNKTISELISDEKIIELLQKLNSIYSPKVLEENNHQ